MITVHPRPEYRLKSKHIQKKMVKKQQNPILFSKITQNLPIKSKYDKLLPAHRLI